MCFSNYYGNNCQHPSIIQWDSSNANNISFHIPILSIYTMCIYWWCPIVYASCVANIRNNRRWNTICNKESRVRIISINHQHHPFTLSDQSSDLVLKISKAVDNHFIAKSIIHCFYRSYNDRRCEIYKTFGLTNKIDQINLTKLTIT